jgi:isoquinoline 1-oxidoreductase beta subunit
MPGVHSVHRLPGAIAVVAERWWNAKRAAEAALVDWQEPADKTSIRYMPADFATDAFRDQLAARMQEGETAETKGNPAAAFDNATKQIEATYHSQYVVHGQLEPPSALARFNDDGTLELWFPTRRPTCS